MVVQKGTPKSSGKTRSSMSSTGMKRVKGENFYRDAKKAAKVKMLTGGKPVYDRDGKVLQAAAFQKGEKDTKPGRVQPDRRWFGNTRVISQTALEHFRESLGSKVHDPYSVLLRRNKLPMTLIDDAKNPHTRKNSHIVETEPFHDTFGPKAQRKRPRLDVGSFEELGKASEEIASSIDKKALEVDENDENEIAQQDAQFGVYQEPIYQKGTSKRIYGELYKVIDSSDVVLHVLDARDPIGTMCQSTLEYIRREKSHKQVVLIVNKCDLVPNWVTARYISHLSKSYPSIAFHASPNHSFGKGTLIQLLRQFSQLHSDRKQISVGLIGYPNVGKSSVINTLKASKVCTVAPIPGETKIWQYITLTRKIYLIDCPGIVPTSARGDSHTSTVLKGVVRVEALAQPSEHISALLERVKPTYLSRTYGIPLPETDETQPSTTWKVEDFLEQLARRKGRLLKGGEPDVEGVAKLVLTDWVRGRIPFFVAPPEQEVAHESQPAVQHELKVQPQKLSGIIQNNKYDGDDVKKLEDPTPQETPGSEEASADDGEDSDEDGEDLAWDDIFEAATGAGDTEATVEAKDSSLHEAEASTSKKRKASTRDSGDDDRPAPKEKRMTTNKKKAENFFTRTNVKNRNRDKAAVLRNLRKTAGKR